MISRGVKGAPGRRQRSLRVRFNTMLVGTVRRHPQARPDLSDARAYTRKVVVAQWRRTAFSALTFAPGLHHHERIGAPPSALHRACQWRNGGVGYGVPLHGTPRSQSQQVQVGIHGVRNQRSESRWFFCVGFDYRCAQPCTAPESGAWAGRPNADLKAEIAKSRADERSVKSTNDIKGKTDGDRVALTCSADACRTVRRVVRFGEICHPKCRASEEHGIVYY